MKTATCHRSIIRSCIVSRRRTRTSTSSSMAAIASLEQAQAQLAHVDGVMMGRAAYQEPWRLLGVDPLLTGEAAPFATPHEAALALIPYIERELAAGTRLHAVTRHLHCRSPRRAGRARLPPRARRRTDRPVAGAELLAAALALVPAPRLDSACAAHIAA